MHPRKKSILAMVSALVFTAALGYTCSPDWTSLAGKAALASAMLAMPQGSIALLEERFADKLAPPAQTDESQVTPYVTPWQDPIESPSTPAAPAEPQASIKLPPAPGATDTAKSSDAAPPSVTETTTPKAYRGTLLQENMAGRGAPNLSIGSGWLRNSTKTPDAEVLSIVEQGLNITLDDTTEPQVLIFHTHATECYEPADSATFDIRNTWRSTDNHVNMVAVGDALEKKLRDGGIGVIHDKTQHDYPSYNGAYERSAATINAYLKKYPSIKIALDVHRDAILRAEDVTVKPVVEIDGKKAAQLMMITGCEDGTMNVPNWPQNLRFTAALQNEIEKKFPSLTRPIFFCYRKYNMDLTNGSVLLEVGSNANTLEESIYTAELVGDAMVSLLKPAATPAAATPAEPDSASAAAVVTGEPDAASTAEPATAEPDPASTAEPATTCADEADAATATEATAEASAASSDAQSAAS